MKWLPKNSPRVMYVLLAGWLLINLVQSFFTELAHDEAYYWMYSRFMDWGYYDHPPMIALWIKAGYTLFQNELGVRLVVALSSIGTLLVMNQLCRRKDFVLLFALAIGVVVFQAYSFIAVPDAPLIFFGAVFFWSYRAYLDNDTTRNALLLSLATALMLYSKYHGFLVLTFTIAAHWQVLKRGSFYAITALVILLYAPHILWQIANDYPSYMYHVVYKSRESFSWVNPLEYIGGQLLVFGPLITIPLFMAAFRDREKQPFERVLRWNIVGFLGFFLLSSFNDQVEANWTAVLLVPLIVLAHNYLLERERMRDITLKLSLVTALLFGVVRFHAMYAILPQKMIKRDELHGWKQWAQEVAVRAQGRPVVFTNSYQKASKYTFYTGLTGFSANNISYRRNQFDLWNIEDSIQGKEVLWIANWPIPRLDTLRTIKDTKNYRIVPSYRSYHKLVATVEEERLQFPAESEVRFKVQLTNGYPHPVRFDHEPDWPASMRIHLFDGTSHLAEIPLYDLANEVLEDTLDLDVSFTTIEPGDYLCMLSIRVGELPPSINSHLIPVTLTKAEE